MNQSVEGVCSQFADRGVQISVTPLPGYATTLLIEGDKMAFELLSKLFLAHADGSDCGFEVSPRGPGNALFARGANLGLYLHRLPCTEK